MLDKVKYYAVVDELSDRKRPAGLFRRTFTKEGGLSDEVFNTDLSWEFSPEFVSYERGDLQNGFIEISEAEAVQLEQQLRARWSAQRDA